MYKRRTKRTVEQQSIFDIITKMNNTSTIDIKLNGKISSNDQVKDVEVEPTHTELMTLDQVADPFPKTAWLLIFARLCEHFVYFGTYIIFQNYVQFPRPGDGDKQSGALGCGRKMATTLTMLYSCLCNISPIGAAIIADQFWGKYKTLIVACFLYFAGLIILVLTSIPVSVKAGVGFPGFICALMILGLAVGAFKAILGPFMAEQYIRRGAVIKGKNICSIFQ